MKRCDLVDSKKAMSSEALLDPSVGVKLAPAVGMYRFRPSNGAGGEKLIVEPVNFTENRGTGWHFEY